MKTKMSGMQLGKHVLGEQVVEHASFDQINVYGELRAKDCHYRTLKVAGEADLENCTIQELKVSGEVECIHCTIETLKVNGEGTCEHCTITNDVHVFGELELHHTKANDIHVLGEIEGKANQCHILSYGGTVINHIRVGSILTVPEIQATTLENFFAIRLDGTQSFHAIVNAGELFSEQEVECAYFFNFKEAQIQELNADFCYLDPSHRASFGDIHGTLVIVDPCFDDAWMKEVALNLPICDFIQKQANYQTKIHCIEADEVILNHVDVDIIRAHKVTLGPDVHVKEVEYVETYNAHEQAMVQRVVKSA